MFKIKQVSRAGAELVAKIVNEAYAQQAEILQITQGNCPAYAGFETKEHVEEAIIKGYEVFVLYRLGTPVGTIRFLVDRNNNGKGYVNYLAVLPEFWNQKCGTTLLEFAEKELFKRHVKRIETSIIKQFKACEDYYLKRGYVIKTDLLAVTYPFEVRYMELDIQNVNKQERTVSCV